MSEPEMMATWVQAKDGSRGVVWWTGDNDSIHDAGLLRPGVKLETVNGLRAERDALRECMSEHCIAKDLSLPVVTMLLADTASAAHARDERLRREGREQMRERVAQAIEAHFRTEGARILGSALRALDVEEP